MDIEETPLLLLRQAASLPATDLDAAALQVMPSLQGSHALSRLLYHPV